MQDTLTISALKRFLFLLREGDAPSDRELARALDELAIAYHETPDSEPMEDNIGPPSKEIAVYKSRYAELGERFPDYGFYRVGDWIKPTNIESITADAIDDLADIESDLEGVLWRSENVSVDDANWHFKFQFETHWGRHLRQLSLYLFEKISRSDP